MIYELDENEFNIAQPLFLRLQEYNLSVLSAIEKGYRGRIFVDDKENPKTGFLYLGRRTFNFAGSPRNKKFNNLLIKILEEDIFPNNREKGSKKFMIFSDPGWDKEVKSLFDNLSIEKRRFYELYQKDKKELEYTLSPDFTFERVDKEFIEERNYTYPDEIPIENWITYLWGTRENFFNRAFAFSIVYKESLVVSTSFCNYLANDKSRCEIGIITKSDFHRQGLGKNLITQVLNLCWQEGINKVEWHTAEDNIASIRLAESVGFKFNRNYKIFYSDCL